MKRFTYLFVILLLSANSFAQGHFVVAYTGNGQDHMNINVVTATIGGVALEAGDEIAAFDGTICCGKATLTQPIIMTNQATFAIIAASRKDDGLLNGYTVGNTITYKIWNGTEISGISAEYFNNTGETIAAPTFTINGTTFVRLTVAVPTNQSPTANAGPDQSVNEGTIVTLDGTSSNDSDSDPLTYLWSPPAGITLSSTTASKPTFTAPEVNSDTQYTFSLVVNDGTVNSTIDQVIITVKQVNKAPVANAGTDQSVNENIQYTLDGSASSDPDGDALTYKWTAPTGITLSSLSASKPTFTAPDVTANTNYTFTLVVNDGKIDSPADQVTITVENIDNAPYVKDPIKDVSVDKKSPNQVIDLRTVFADNDLGDVLSYVVSSNSNGNVVAATITGFDLTLIFSTENTGLSEIEITASSNGKEAISKFKVEVKIPTGINPLINSQNVKVYPNPTSGRITVVFDQIPQNGTYLTVRSLIGATILKKLVQNIKETIDLSGNTPGVYLIQTNKNSYKVRKVILK